MTSPGQRKREFRAKLEGLSDRELVAVISRAMRTFNVELLKSASSVMAERKS